MPQPNVPLSRQERFYLTALVLAPFILAPLTNIVLVSNEDSIAWYCSGVTNQTWKLKKCEDSSNSFCAHETCMLAMYRALGHTPLPCSLLGIPMMCTLNDGGSVSIQTVWDIHEGSGTRFHPPQLEELGDNLVILEPTTPGPFLE